MSYIGYSWLSGLSHQRKKAVALCITLGFLPSLATADDYDRLIVAARQGDEQPVLNFFRQQSAQRTLSASEVADWLQISAWAGQDKQVVAVWQRYGEQMTLPVRGQVAAARALRNLQQWDRSLALWREALTREPRNDDVHSGLIMTLADAGQQDEALQLARQQVSRQPTAQHWLDLAYCQRAAGKTWDALQSTRTARDAFPQQPVIERAWLSSLSANRVSGPARRESTRITLPAAEQRQVESDAAAELVRIAVTSSRTEAGRFDVADRALARYDHLLAAWKNQPEAQADYQRARIDRIGALVARSRMQEAVDEYQRLTAEGDPLPVWARRWVAAAYLNLHQPDRALALYQSVQRDGTPDSLSRSDNSDLYYAYAEDEQLDRAQQQGETFDAANPYYRRIYGSPLRVPNDSWLDAQQLRVQSSLLEDDLAGAQRRAEHLAHTAPGNQGLQIDLASIYLARGWPRRAEAELKRAESMEPRNLALENQQGQTALALQEWQQADLLADDVIRRQPENTSARRLDRLRDVHHDYELRIEGEQGIDSNSPIKGANDVSLDALLYSPPINDRWRLFSGLSFSDSEFSEGKAINRSLRGGVEYRTRDNWAEAELNGQRYGDGQQMGLRLSGWHDLNDQWRFGGSAERRMREAPLQALRNGISANGATLFTRWRGDERRQWQASVSPTWFSDGNQRLEYTLSGEQRLLSGARYTLDFTPTISGSHNSQTSGPYYSPSSDLAVVPGLTLDHLMYRHYQTEWSQQISLGVGSGWQQGQGSGAVTTVGYGQRMRWNDVLDSGVMLTWDKRPYDGVSEHNLSVSFDLTTHF
ncbi:poly-beta-1,6 N-acetyl-D-glucosamine export porin PgaA [Pseudomonas cerasi]